MSSIKDFKDQNGYVLAHAAIPDGYQIGGSLVNGFQHESVPFFVTVHAVNPETKAIIYGLTDEKYTTYKNQMIKMTLKAMSDVKWNSIRDFIEPEVYLDTFAAALSGMPSIKAVGKADLPSICGKNQQQAFNDFMALYQDSFERDASLGTPTRANNILVKSFMRKYDGVAKSGAACTVIAGMDYNGIEYYSEASMLGAINPLAGLLGAAVKNKQAAGSSKKFGQGSPCDAIDWGAKNKFLLVCPKEHERAALVDFMEFVQTFHMDPHLRNQFYQQISQRIQMRMQETARFQSMARAQNSQAMSNMIMDSWNQKQASDARISQARSEAIRGVNSYQTTYGQNVDVSVTADHVYQDRYGDVYGVSGTAPDQEFLNRNDWTELNKNNE